MNRNSRRSMRSVSAASTAVIAGLLLAGCAAPAADEESSSPDNGTELTMWARFLDGELPSKIVDAYNASHENQIKLTVIPNDDYQQKVGAAAGANGLPDLLAADVVYSPNYVKQGLFQDITAQVESLPFADDLSPAHSDAASLDGKIYGAPFIVDSSLIIYNKDLFTQAGLDPESPPTSFDEIYADAAAVRALGGDTYGFYFGGNCSGCNAYTMMPYLAAAGEPPLEDDGTTANIDSDAMNETLALYKKMVDNDIVPAGAKTEDGSTWSALFNAGKIGIIPIGTFDFAALADASFDWGIAALPAPDGSAGSTFVGGDMIGITKNSTHLDQAFDFIQWSLDDEAQVEVTAKSGNLPSRVDLADNKYSAEDPRIVTTIEGLADGYTPSSTAYGEIFNNANGPWIGAIRSYIFEGNTDALTEAQTTIQAALDDAQ